MASATMPLYDLRPLSTGELLDRTFSLYRKRFWLFAGLAVVASSLLTLSTFVQLTWGTAHHAPAVANAKDPFAAFRGPELPVLLVTVVITSFLYWFVYSLTQAATVHAVSEVYLGRETTIMASFERVRRYWLRYAMIAFWQGWSVLWLPLTLVALGGGLAAGSVKVPALAIGAAVILVAAVLSYFYGFYAWMRNSLGIVASVIEDLNVKDALKRSKVLTRQRVLRVLALVLLLFVLSIAVGFARAIPSGALGVVWALKPGSSTTLLAVLLEGLALITTFITGALLLPVGAIAFCLFYIDERVRREGFDVEMLLGLGAGVQDRAVAQQGLASPFSGSGLV